MRQRLIVLACVLAGCAEPTSPQLSSLVGVWTTAPVRDPSDSASYTTSIELNDDLSFVHRLTVRAPYGNVLASIATSGTFRLLGDSIALRPSFTSSLDLRVNGGAFILSGASGNGPYDGGAHFQIRNDSLTLRYHRFHPDLPVEDVEVYTRLRVISAAVR